MLLTNTSITMRKVFSFLGWKISIQILLSISCYIFWFLNYPMEFISYDYNYNNFTTGLILVSIYIISLLALRLVTNYRFVFILALLLFVAPLFLININHYFSFLPYKTEAIKFNNYNYFVLRYPNQDYRSITSFYKCRFSTLYCSFIYKKVDLSIGNIITDENNQEISILDFTGEWLLFTEKNNKRILYSSNAITFKGFVYQFAEECSSNNIDDYNCNLYTHRLYRCNLDFRNCKALPVQYTTSDYIETPVFEILPNNKLAIYSDFPNLGGKLIFTYDESPKCYSVSCEILKP